ncbi:hypothetical protein [Sporomusa acidovorans]|uniref:Uncharacterized protein n=1 Tax=Sporomusa acidovorans (strain ATCC 49682 / DSM 3132 / Mol) TaxID=1123286 RepID=A0ABZ3JBW0_SPOA4|nr:hypothetical protein [Sporomusa acidovorans]OZC21629.1 hypothetical protein SPACI_17020 [Sporomusa acidovorans DSM 3132]SDD62049.1 hypothetical protein SAMN04488499_1002239 [Sporomusa acidovorans]
MLAGHEIISEQLRKPQGRTWPLKGSFAVFAGIVYVLLLLV